MKSSFPRPLKIAIIVSLGGIIFFFLTSLVWVTPSHALPEYAMRTGEPCATCHVSPGGGGPRTLRGLLWAAKGKPDQVPDLPGILMAPGVSAGSDLFEIACSACHGKLGEGIFGAELANSGLSEKKIRSQVLNGRVRSGMPSFNDKFTPEQLDALVTYVAGLASGEVSPPPDSYPLPLGRLSCVPFPDDSDCGGN